MRDQQGAFTSAITAAAMPLLEKFGGAAADNPELEALPEDVQTLLGDKDAMMNAIQVE